MADASFDKCLVNRELSWLDFNLRVLEEAKREDNPLLERERFAAIFLSNLDEFFMVRVGALCDRILISPSRPENKKGLLPREELSLVLKKCRAAMKEWDDTTIKLDKLLSKKAGITLVRASAISAAEKKHMIKEFQFGIIPVLSPQVIDGRHPFPNIVNHQLHVAFLLEKKGKGKQSLGILPIPKSLPRICSLREPGKYMLIEDVVQCCAEVLFPGFTIVESLPMKVTRSADIDPDEWLPDESGQEDYRVHMKKVLKKRARLAPVRLLTGNGAKSELAGVLRERFNLPAAQCFSCQSPIDLSYAFSIDKLVQDEALRSSLSFPPFTPAESYRGHKSLIKEVNRGDILLCYPFDSMKPFLALIREAGSDRAVLSIKITLYRIAPFSELASALIAAAENGKEVLVLVELRARFDEENNIQWADKLEEAGCRVIYGPDGLKTHSKLCLITRQEKDGLRYITQVGTGNYNEKTAKIYTDLSIITADQVIGTDAAHAFLTLSIGSVEGGYSRLWVAPEEFLSHLLEKIDGEIKKAENGGQGSLILKCNAITDMAVIERLVTASRAGVKIDLIVRGICCIKPGVLGYSENITVLSIVGRFLEHSRIYSFGEGSEREIFISSGDLMTRSTMRRVEIACPVLDDSIKQKIADMLDLMLRDNTNARLELPDGTYSLPLLKKGEPAVSSQLLLCGETEISPREEAAAVIIKGAATAEFAGAAPVEVSDVAGSLSERQPKGGKPAGSIKPKAVKKASVSKKGGAKEPTVKAEGKPTVKTKGK